jgi:hypothetical protein
MDMPSFRTFILTAFFVGLQSGPATFAQMAGALTPASSQDDIRNIADIDFSFKNVKPQDAITSIGLQTHIPIAIVLGADATALCSRSDSYSLHEVTPRYALEQVAQTVGYAVEERDGVVMLMAPDVTTHTRDLLTHRFEQFDAGGKVTMHLMSATLTGWLWVEVDQAGGWGYSIGDSTQAYAITLPALSNVTTQEIADWVIKTGMRGMWILRGKALGDANLHGDGIEFYSWSEPLQVRAEALCK